jgi:hypothetical protein
LQRPLIFYDGLAEAIEILERDAEIIQRFGKLGIDRDGVPVPADRGLEPSRQMVLERFE